MQQTNPQVSVMYFLIMIFDVFSVTYLTNTSLKEVYGIHSLPSEETIYCVVFAFHNIIRVFQTKI